VTTSDLPQTPEPRRRFRRPTLSSRAIVILAIVALLLAAAAFVVVIVVGQGAQTDAATTKQDTAPAVLTLDTLCNRNDQLGADLRGAGACGEKIDKAKSAVEGQPSPAVSAPGLSRDDVTAIVTGQLAGKTVTVDQVMAMVTQVYNANRPKDAPPPTGEQVLAAVQQVCGSTKCEGPPGKDGEPAPPVTDAQIYAQVAAYCSGDNAPCQGPMGPKGDQGDPGVSIIAQTFARNDAGECRNYITLSSDPSRRIDSGPASDAACPVPEPASPPPTP
jgi:hypothetical protein